MGNYTIQAGDTLSKIAQKFKTTVQKLASTNGITNPNFITAGTELEVGENKSNFDSFEISNKPAVTRHSSNQTESYAEYEQRTGGAKAEKVFNEYKGSALERISFTKGKDYRPTQQELNDAVADVIMDEMLTFNAMDPADEFRYVSPAIWLEGIGRPKSGSERYAEAKDKALDAISKLEAIMPKLSPEKQAEVKAAIDSFNKKTSGSSLDRFLKEKNKGSNFGKYYI